MSDESEVWTVEAPCWECGEPVEIPQPAHSDCIEHEIKSIDDLEDEIFIPASEIRELGMELRDMANSLERRENTTKADAYRSAYIGVKLLLEGHGASGE